jgi:hypothetical protein
MFAPLHTPVTNGGTNAIAKIPSYSAPRRTSIWWVFVIRPPGPGALEGDLTDARADRCEPTAAIAEPS